MLVADEVEQGDGQDNAQDKVGERRYHERTHRACAAQHAVADEFDADDDVERHDGEQIAAGDIHNPRCAAGRQEQADDTVCERQIDHHEHDAETDRERSAGLEAGADTVELARADVLCDVARQTGRKRHAAGQRKHIDAVCDRETGDDSRAAQVDVILNDEVADRDEALLRDGGDSVVGQTAQHFGCEQDEMMTGVKGAHAAHEQEEGEHARCALRDKGRPGNACNAPVQYGNEYDVENDVADRGQDEQEQRRPAVAHGVENAGAHVVDEQEQQTEHIHAQIERGVRENIRRGVERTHQTVGADRAEQRQQQRDDGRGDQGGRDRGLHAQVALRAEQLRDEDGGADVDACRNSNEQLRDRITCADGGERKLTGLCRLGKTADDHGVRHLVQLLECNAQQERHGEPEQLFRWTAFGQISDQNGMPSFAFQTTGSLL